MMDAGHNERAVRLAALAGDAQIALDKVASGEADAVTGWLAYGAALNEGRALHAGDREFGQWIKDNVLGQVAQAEIEPKDQQAAMWAAANADQLAEAKAASKARTLRGWHDQWKKIEREREKAAQEAERKAKAEADKKKREAEAEAARQEADQKAVEEEEARKAAQNAEDEGERAAAEKRAEEAAAARAQAEKVAESVSEEPDPEPDPDAEARAKLSGLTREGLEDEVIGLRAENAELRAKLAAVTAERDDFKAKLKEATSEDMGRALGNAQRQRDTLKGRLDEKMAENARQARRIKHLEAEKNALQSKLENQEVEI